MTITLTPLRTLALPTAARLDRILFIATTLLAGGLMWLAPRLPMVDLPQHAAQVALWRDLLSGTSPWSDLVHINLLTPYLIGYGLMLPLSFILSVSTAAKVVLTLAFYGFVAACILLRRTFDGDRRLDWMFLFGFFGFAWQWGFLTFLVAAPLGLLFITLAQVHGRAPTPRRGLSLVALGIVVLFSHGLIFLMAAATGGALTLWHLAQRRFQRAATALAPFVVLAAALALFRALTRSAEGAAQFDAVVYGAPLWLRPGAALAFVSGMDWPSPLQLAPTLVAVLAPLALRSAPGRGGAPILVLTIVAILLAVPAYAFQTAFLFNRFALFLLPFYALAFRAPLHPPTRRDHLAVAALACASWIALGSAALRIAAFGAESRPFETILAAAEPGHRALALIFDKESAAADNLQAYMHYAAWYGADKQGFVDFNFAAFHPQVVRFRPGRRPPITDGKAWHPADFDWSASDGRIYDYIIVRGTTEDVQHLRGSSPCRLATVTADGPWTLLRRTGCRGPAD